MTRGGGTSRGTKPSSRLQLPYLSTQYLPYFAQCPFCYIIAYTSIHIMRSASLRTTSKSNPISFQIHRIPMRFAHTHQHRNGCNIPRIPAKKRLVEEHRCAKEKATSRR